MLEEEFFAWTGANYAYIAVVLGLAIVCVYIARTFFKKI
jgi:hypothetical protein